MKFAASVVSAILVLGGALTAWLTITFDWEEKQRAYSPDGTRVAYLMESRTEAGVAPYGEHVVVAQSWVPFAGYFQNPAFAGYCKDGAAISWKTERTLVIECNSAERILRKENRSNDVQIEYPHG